MSGSLAKIRIKLGQAEVEIESPLEEMKQTISMIPDVLELLAAQSRGGGGSIVSLSNVQGQVRPDGSAAAAPPEIPISKSDSLTDILTKIFRESYGRQPRKLIQVRDVLSSYGLAYPKQTVAVTLLRMAQSGKLRRFKDESGEYQYTASTSLASGTFSKDDVETEKIALIAGAGT